MKWIVLNQSYESSYEYIYSFFLFYICWTIFWKRIVINFLKKYCHQFFIYGCESCSIIIIEKSNFLSLGKLCWNHICNFNIFFYQKNANIINNILHVYSTQLFCHYIHIFRLYFLTWCSWIFILLWCINTHTVWFIPNRRKNKMKRE